jgi:hypothetical protein
MRFSVGEKPEDVTGLRACRTIKNMRISICIYVYSCVHVCTISVIVKSQRQVSKQVKRTSCLYRFSDYYGHRFLNFRPLVHAYGGYRPVSLYCIR